MKEAYENAVSELKRVDHLFYVSLKYTRTADMMRHMIERMINSYSFAIESILKYHHEESAVPEVPDNPAMRVQLLQQHFADDQELMDHLQFYMLMRKIIRSPYTKREEFRRHVTMTSTLPDGNMVETNIDSLKEDYEKNRAFIKYVKILLQGEDDI